jgi:hypothetical protein
MLMRKKLIIAGVAALAITGAVAGTASASVAVDDQGVGFVGKGDIQNVFGGWNNKQLQDNADKLAFNVNSTDVKVTADDWTCVKTTVTGNGTVKETRQERAVTTTTTNSKTSVVTAVARVKSQITGFNMTGFGATTNMPSTVVDGPPALSCPDASSGYVLDPTSVIHTDVSDVTTTSGLTVTYGDQTHSLPNTPVIVPIA